MMNNIEDVIKQDSRWLLHFLKERHIKKQFFDKIYNTTDKNIKPKTFDEYIDNNIALIKQYLIYFERQFEENKFNDILFKNTNLIGNNDLFSTWYISPFVFCQNGDNFFNYDEFNVWFEIRDKYYFLKEKLSKIFKG